MATPEDPAGQSSSTTPAAATSSSSHPAEEAMSMAEGMCVDPHEWRKQLRRAQKKAALSGQPVLMSQEDAQSFLQENPIQGDVPVTTTSTTTTPTTTVPTGDASAQSGLTLAGNVDGAKNLVGDVQMTARDSVKAIQGLRSGEQAVDGAVDLAQQSNQVLHAADGATDAAGAGSKLSKLSRTRASFAGDGEASVSGNSTASNALAGVGVVTSGLQVYQGVNEIRSGEYVNGASNVAMGLSNMATNAMTLLNVAGKWIPIIGGATNLYDGTKTLLQANGNREQQGVGTAKVVGGGLMLVGGGLLAGAATTAAATGTTVAALAAGSVVLTLAAPAVAVGGAIAAAAVGVDFVYQNWDWIKEKAAQGAQFAKDAATEYGKQAMQNPAAIPINPGAYY